MIVFYHQTKTPINFWCRWGLNFRSFIQSLETLSIELAETYNYYWFLSLWLRIKLPVLYHNILGIMVGKRAA